MDKDRLEDTPETRKMARARVGQASFAEIRAELLLLAGSIKTDSVEVMALLGADGEALFGLEILLSEAADLLGKRITAAPQSPSSKRTNSLIEMLTNAINLATERIRADSELVNVLVAELAEHGVIVDEDWIIDKAFEIYPNLAADKAKHE